MPIRLKNAGVLYQRVMDQAFEAKIGWNVEVYVGDITVKSKEDKDLVQDIKTSSPDWDYYR